MKKYFFLIPVLALSVLNGMELPYNPCDLSTKGELIIKALLAIHKVLQDDQNHPNNLVAEMQLLKNIKGFPSEWLHNLYKWLDAKEKFLENPRRLDFKLIVEKNKPSCLQEKTLLRLKDTLKISECKKSIFPTLTKETQGYLISELQKKCSNKSVPSNENVVRQLLPELSPIIDQFIINTFEKIYEELL